MIEHKKLILLFLSVQLTSFLTPDPVFAGLDTIPAYLLFLSPPVILFSYLPKMFYILCLDIPEEKLLFFCKRLFVITIFEIVISWCSNFLTFWISFYFNEIFGLILFLICCGIFSFFPNMYLFRRNKNMEVVNFSKKMKIMHTLVITTIPIVITFLFLIKIVI